MRVIQMMQLQTNQHSAAVVGCCAGARVLGSSRPARDERLVRLVLPSHDFYFSGLAF
ncbi:hypothetical protein BD311DRAFT_764725, partial [Dichomitus squalens]